MIAHVARHPVRAGSTAASLSWSLASWGGVGLAFGVVAVALLAAVFAVLFKKVGDLTVDTTALSSSVSKLSKQVGKIEDGLGVSRDE